MPIWTLLVLSPHASLVKENCDTCGLLFCKCALYTSSHLWTCRLQNLMQLHASIQRSVLEFGVILWCTSLFLLCIFLLTIMFHTLQQAPNSSCQLYVHIYNVECVSLSVSLVKEKCDALKVAGFRGSCSKEERCFLYCWLTMKARFRFND